MLSLKEYLEKTQDDDVNYFIAEVPQSWLEAANLEIILERWREFDGIYSYRVDAENPAIPLQRHIHIAKTTHKSSKGMQASWNVDGTRHDKGSFNDKLGKQRKAREIAMKVLKLDSDIALESYVEPMEGTVMLLECLAKDEKIKILLVE